MADSLAVKILSSVPLHPSCEVLNPVPLQFPHQGVNPLPRKLPLDLLIAEIGLDERA